VRPVTRSNVLGDGYMLGYLRLYGGICMDVSSYSKGNFCPYVMFTGMYSSVNCASLKVTAYDNDAIIHFWPLFREVN